ncbi:unnamed protein product [Amoebophrya sp. A120]|nr:unnamed protein product [Amoebophrya sp. A120]|eukprot:GSA120T00018293001.1
MELRFPKRSGIRGFLDGLVCFVIWHYLVWGLFFAFGVIPAAFYFLGARICGYAGLLYFLQLLIYRPHLKRGLEPDFLWHWFLFNPILNGIMHHLDGTLIREMDDSKMTKSKSSEDGTRNTSESFLFAWEPHGIMGLCRCGSGGSGWPALFPNLFPRWGAFGKGFYIPGVREFSLICGCVDAGRPTLNKVAKESIHLIPGGVREMVLTDPDSTVTKIPLKDRKGFVKLAVEKNLRLVPVFCFGEKWCYHRVLVRPAWLRKWLLKNQLTPTLLLGRWNTLMPFTDRKMAWVFGKPIEVENRDIDSVHAEYLSELERIFEQYKARFGYAAEEKVEFVTVAEAFASGVVEDEKKKS